MNPTKHLFIHCLLLVAGACSAPAANAPARLPLIEHKDDGVGRIAVSEWNSTHWPGFMVFDGRWKFLFGQSASAPSLAALYDLQHDPNEITNLIGRNPDGAQSRAEAERMKRLLVAWLARVKSPYWEAVTARPAIGAAEVRPENQKAQ